MVTKLKFKGEKQKKRKRTQDDAEKQLASEDNGQEGWTNAESLDDISTGPLFITFASSSPVAVASDPLGKIYASPITGAAEGEIGNAEPSDIRQVWIATKVIGSNKISLKTATGKFLSCDRIGILSASKEAIGPQEEWEPIQRDDGWAFQNVFERFLYHFPLDSVGKQANHTRSVDEVAAGGKVEIRGDAESVGFNETFILRIQARLRKRSKTTPVVHAEPKLSRRDLEKMYWSSRKLTNFSAGKALSDEQVKELRKAKKEGWFNSALLDIRTKSKSDKYA